MRLFGRIVYYT